MGEWEKAGVREVPTHWEIKTFNDLANEGAILFTHKVSIGGADIVGKIKTSHIMLTPQVTYYGSNGSKYDYSQNEESV